MRATGVVSTACDSGVLEDELDLPGVCATSAGATTRPATNNATAAAAINSRRGPGSMRSEAFGTIRDREERFKLVSCL
jgi:hypothetical protein